MANFPTAVTNYTTRNPGDVIPSADWDSFGAEITAIEDGYINGTARLNSSNSTISALTVTNGSTLNTLQVNGNSTFAGNVTINGILTFSANRVACTLTHSASQNVNSGSATGLNFDTESSDPGSMHSTSVNSSRINFPVAGTYMIGGYVQWSGNSTAGTVRQLFVRVNDVTGIVGVQNSPPSGLIAVEQTVNALYTPASTTEYATLVVSQDSGSTMSISSGIAQVRMWAALVGI